MRCITWRASLCNAMRTSAACMRRCGRRGSGMARPYAILAADSCVSSCPCCVIVRAMMPAGFVVSRSCRWGKKCDTFGLTNGRKSIGTDIAEPDPAPIGTVRMRAEMPRGVHVARPSPRRHDTGWRATGWLGYGLVGLLTGGTEGLAGEARKRLRVAGALARWQDGLHWSPLCRSALARPGSMQHEK